MAFLMKTSETKKLSRFFSGIFDFKKIFRLSHSRTYFHAYITAFLNSQAVRIRVKAVSISPRLEQDLQHVTVILLCRHM
jgi:hypothetical protein